MVKQLTSLISRVLFISAFIISCAAVLEKVANIVGYTLTRGYYSNWQLLEFSVIALLFVIAFQLREIKLLLDAKNN